MKQRVCCTLFIGIFVLFMVGCSKEVQDKPLPMSQDNLEIFASELEKAAKSIAPSPSQDGAELMVGAYKMVLEKKMGYSFDKTLRSVMLFYHLGAPWQLMSPVIGYVHSDPKKALDKGFISQRTFDILDTGSKAKAALTKEGDEFLSFVAECQSQNGGVCGPKLLLNVLAAHNALPALESSSIEYQLESKYDIFHMGINKWITKPDGQHISTNGLLSRGEAYKFVINKTQIDISKRYTNMLAEEKAAL
ncbi:MAG: hypothetical protein ACSLFL_11295 [Alphaproteobacteria bacterium]